MLLLINFRFFNFILFFKQFDDEKKKNDAKKNKKKKFNQGLWKCWQYHLLTYCIGLAPHLWLNLRWAKPTPDWPNSTNKFIVVIFEFGLRSDLNFKPSRIRVKFELAMVQLGSSWAHDPGSDRSDSTRPYRNWVGSCSGWVESSMPSQLIRRFVTLIRGQKSQP